MLLKVSLVKRLISVR